MSRDYIWKEILDERAKQDQEHGGIPNDDNNSMGDWVNWIVRHLGKSLTWDWNIFRYQMVRVAALAVAAIEMVDRKLERLK
jgi:hypothetical protein